MQWPEQSTDEWADTDNSVGHSVCANVFEKVQLLVIASGVEETELEADIWTAIEEVRLLKQKFREEA